MDGEFNRPRRIEPANSNAPADSIRELINVIRANQKVFGEVIKLNAETVRHVSELTSQISDLAKRVDMLISHMQTPSQTPSVSAKKDDELYDRMDKLERRLNAFIIATMPRRRTAPAPMM